MKLLLTGGTGFIGNYFQNNYGDLYKISTFSFHNDDIHKLVLKDIDIIVHLSALVHQMGGASKEEYFKINVDNTLELAKKAKENNVKQFIFMSSVKVYGEESNIPYTETSKCEPQDDYGLSKLEAENTLKDMEDKNFTISILRTPIVYGYGVKANIENLINLVNKVPILPFANIQNRRSMVYIGNLCHLLDTIIRKQSSGIFLAADDQALSTSKFISMISEASHKNNYLIKVPFFESLLKLIKPSFHKRLYESLEVNNQSSKTKLNFKNIYTTEEGIQHMIYGKDT